MSASPHDAPSEPELIVDVDDAIVSLTLNRPRARNALTLPMLQGVLDALRRSQGDGTRAVVLTGGDVFCAGGDVRSMPGPDAGLFAPTERLDVIHAIIRTASDSTVPLVVAVDGYAIGAGWGLALAADIVVCGSDAWFAAPFSARGLAADAGVAFHLPRRLGPHRAASHLLLGTRLGAADALAAGLVTEVVDAGRATHRALEIARLLAAGPRESNAVTTSLIARTYAAELSSFLDTERLAVALAGHGRDAIEGRAAFRERREPRFT